MSNAKLDDQSISFCAGTSEEMEQRYHLYTRVSSSMDNADRTSSKVGLNTRQRARFEAVAHTCVAWWHLTGTGGFRHPKLLIEVY